MNLTKPQLEILQLMAQGEFVGFDRDRRTYYLSVSRRTVRRPTLRALRLAGLVGGSRITEKGRNAVAGESKQKLEQEGADSPIQILRAMVQTKPIGNKELAGWVKNNKT